ncbi:MAG: hypothetical protein R2744_08120 [Bacteroidales bacterium]
MVLLTTLNKNLVFPALLILIFSVFSGGFLSGIDRIKFVSVVITEAAMPCMANIVIVARIIQCR